MFTFQFHNRHTIIFVGFGIESACLFSLSFIYDGGVAIAVLSAGVSLGGLAVSGKLMFCRLHA